MIRLPKLGCAKNGMGGGFSLGIRKEWHNFGGLGKKCRRRWRKGGGGTAVAVGNHLHPFEKSLGSSGNVRICVHKCVYAAAPADTHVVGGGGGLAVEGLMEC